MQLRDAQPQGLLQRPAQSAHSLQAGFLSAARRTCAAPPPGPTTGISSVTVWELRPLMLWVMELWETGGPTCTAPPSSCRSCAEDCSTRAARSCGMPQ